MIIKFLYFFTVLLVLVTSSGKAFSQNSKPESRLSNNNQQTQSFVDFCKVIRKPEKYNGKTFSTKATYVVTFDSTTLFSPNCVQKEIVVDAYLDCNSEDNCKALNQKIPLDVKSGDLFGQGINVELNLKGKLVVNSKNKTISFYIKDIKGSEISPKPISQEKIRMIANNNSDYFVK